MPYISPEKRDALGDLTELISRSSISGPGHEEALDGSSPIIKDTSGAYSVDFTVT